MSEDRFKQARRSLIDRHNQRQQAGFDDFEDEATAMVDLGSVRPTGPAGPAQGHGGPSTPFTPGDEATEMFSIDEYAIPERPAAAGGVQIRTGAQMQGHHPPPPTFGGHDPQPAVQVGAPAMAGAAASQQMKIGDDVGYEGTTQFINIADLAQSDPAHHVAPDQGAAGYEGNTQFVDLNALQAGAAAEAGTSVENDPVLRQSYHFTPENVQHGEFTLIFATNAMGLPIVLKRVWEGDVNSMPFELRQRVVALEPIRHPRLVNLNGMFNTPSGAWVELNRPSGYRLTDILAQNGPQPAENVAIWVQQAAEVLTAIHQYQFVYANLTTDAIWVQDDGSIILEPFDVLTFESRGNLGPFGPPELSVPPQQRHVSPSTDVYSLAAVTVAALSGIPVNLGAAGMIDKKFAGPCSQSLGQNPAERIQTPAEFAAAVGGKAKKGGLPAINMKVIIGVAALLGFGLIGGLYFQQEQQRAAAEAAAVADANTTPDESAGAKESETPEKGTAAEKGQAAEKGEAAEKVAGVESDARLAVATSFQKNPVVDEGGSNKASEEELDDMRNKAREAIKDVKRLTRKAQRERYEESLGLMAQLARAGDLTDDDKEFLSDLLATSTVKTIRKENLDAVAKALQDDKLTSAKLQYQYLERIDSAATSKSFFSRNKSATIEKVERTKAEPDAEKPDAKDDSK